MLSPLVTPLTDAAFAFVFACVEGGASSVLGERCPSMRGDTLRELALDASAGMREGAIEEGEESPTIN